MGPAALTAPRGVPRGSPHPHGVSSPSATIPPTPRRDRPSVRRGHGGTAKQAWAGRLPPPTPAARGRRGPGSGRHGAVTFPRQMWQVMGSVRDSVTLGPCCAIAAPPARKSRKSERAGGRQRAGGPATASRRGQVPPGAGEGEQSAVRALLKCSPGGRAGAAGSLNAVLTAALMAPPGSPRPYPGAEPHLVGSRCATWRRWPGSCVRWRKVAGGQFGPQSAVPSSVCVVPR